MSRQHPSRTGPSRWRECNHRSHDNLQQDLAGRRTANPMDLVLSHHTYQERQPAAVPELPNNQPQKSPQQSHAEDHIEQTEATSGEVPAGSPSRGGDVKFSVLDINQASLPTPFILFLCLFLSYGPFTCISFHKFSRQLSVFSPAVGSCGRRN